METNTNLFSDLGFGTKINPAGGRLLKKNGSFNIQRKGKSSWATYYWLTEMSSTSFVVMTLSYFFASNALFATLFIIVGTDQLNGIPEGNFTSDFLYALFFSMQTFTTVGYGAISPAGISANMIASLCAWVGVVSFALITGLFFARFSRPRSHIAFSRKALLTPYQDGLSFQCRIVNRKNHQIIELTAQIILSWIETEDGNTIRRFHALELERDQVVLFPLNWTLVHPITEQSPLFNKTLADFERMKAEFLVIVSGFDESYNQAVHDNSSYTYRELVEGVRFQQMYSSDEEGTTLHLGLLDEVLPVD